VHHIAKTELLEDCRDFQESNSRSRFSNDGLLAPGVGFERKVKPDLLSVRVYNFIVSNGSANIQTPALLTSPGSTAKITNRRCTPNA
jgi:hypothetical protein